VPAPVFALVAAFALSACQATLRVGIDAHRDGSGTVTVTATLDRDAAGVVGDLGQQLRTADLAQAGWTVSGPRPVPDGGVEIQAAKPFGNRAEAIRVLAELSGGAPGKGTGPFNGLAIDERRGFLASTMTFHGVVDLTCGLACFGDAALQQQLGGPAMGIDPAKLQQQTGNNLNRILRFEVAVRLPGTLRSSNAATKAANSAEWQFGLGDKVQLAATSRSWNATNMVSLAIAITVVAGLLAAVAFVIRRRLAAGRRRPGTHFRS
jgi:hypothetical protein